LKWFKKKEAIEMAYTDSKIQCIREGQEDSATLGFAKNKTVVLQVMHPCDLYAVGALIRVALDTDAAVLTVTRNVIPYDATGATAVASITIPTLTPAGKIIYKECHILTVKAPVKLNAGDELKFVFANNGGGVYWKPWFEAYPRPETKDNNSDFIKSA
jgi:hypothetical protein